MAPCNKNQLTYVITQYPEGKEVGQTKKLAFNGTVTSHSFSDYYFGVKAVVNGKTGEEGLSNHATHGDFADIPYYDDFSNTDTHGTYTIVNTRDDATWEFKNSNIGGMAAIYDGSQCNNVADDYLILPPMNISKGHRIYHHIQGGKCFQSGLRQQPRPAPRKEQHRSCQR